jgi:hypothetical protein
MTSTKPQLGYFFLADISGFSSYLVGVELEHAGVILQKLLESVARNIEPPFSVQDFDTDSVFAYASEAQMDRTANLQELIEATYLEFRNNLTEISDHITCTCAACRNVTSLDLKFMIHYGDYILSRVQEKKILYGLDPTFVRNRGWKETVSASVTWRGYILFTEPCLASLHVNANIFQGKEFEHNQLRMFGLELKSDDHPDGNRIA